MSNAARWDEKEFLDLHEILSNCRRSSQTKQSAFFFARLGERTPHYTIILSSPIMPSPSQFKSSAQTWVVFVCTSSVIVLSLLVYRKRTNEERRSDGNCVWSSVGNGKQGSNASSPMFDYRNPILSDRIIDMAKQRAKRWMSYQVSGANRMVGQVGGLSKHKRPLLMCDPDLILKPLSLDHRGIREIAFYEAIQASTKRSGFKTYADLFGPRCAKQTVTGLLDWFRNWKKSCTTETQPPYDEKLVELETKLLHRIELFTPEYLGIVQYSEDSSSTGMIEDGLFGMNSTWYIVLRNLTTHFSKPCVMDLKMGTETYEPDAPEDKILRERSKYPMQGEFGFRVVAMRIYSPADVEACDDGYIYFPKKFGRSLESRNQIKLAMRTFFGGNHLSKEVRANRSTAIKKILTKLKLILGWFLDNTCFTFSASSLLMVYEGATEANELEGVDQGMILLRKLCSFSV